jgi:hypothetical protein
LLFEKINACKNNNILFREKQVGRCTRKETVAPPHAQVRFDVEITKKAQLLLMLSFLVTPTGFCPLIRGSKR